MRSKKLFALCLSFSFICLLLLTPSVLLFAQPVTDTLATGGASSFIDKIPAWVIPLVLGLYELIVRIYPTAKSWSILTVIIKIIKTVIPDNSTQAITKTTTTH